MQINRPTPAALNPLQMLARPQMSPPTQKPADTRPAITKAIHPSDANPIRPGAMRPPSRTRIHTLPVPPSTIEMPISKKAQSLIAAPKPVEAKSAASTAASLESSPPLHTMLDLVGDWGKSNSPYDFDNDGTVGVPDLLHFINNYRELTQTPVSGAASALTSPATETANGEAAQQSDSVPLPEVVTLDDSVEEPTDPTLPPVDPVPTPAIDVLTRLGLTADSSKSQRGGLNGAAARAALGLEAPGKSAGHSMGGLRTLTDSLFQHLSSSGFADQPPTNIRELIDTLNLTPKQSDFMLKHMAEKYPAGMGVDEVA